MKNEPPGLTSREYPSFRYVRFQAFETWGAQGIISALPSLLVASLLAFFAGLLTLSSNKDILSTIPLYVILPTIFAITVFTTVSPAIHVIRYSAFRKGPEFTPMPPFQSLQSWVALRALVRLFQAVSGFFELNAFGAFSSLVKSPDWGHLDHLWSYWSVTYPEDTLMFPLTLSTGTVDSFNTIAKLFEEEAPSATPLKDRRLGILILIVSTMGAKLPSTTTGHIIDMLLVHLVQLINSGTSFLAIRTAFDHEELLLLDVVPNSKDSLFNIVFLMLTKV